MFSTPNEYINYYVDILKKEYELNDLKIDYHGFVGFLMNLFGWTNFDIQQFYNYLFKEGFLATAEDKNNLYLHASRVGYPIEFAKPSVAYGNLIFDFSKISPRSSNVFKRELILPSPFSITVNNFIFTTLTKYKFVEEFDGINTNYYCTILLENGRQRVISSLTSKIEVPFYSFQQYELKTYKYNASNYDYGTYNSYPILLNSDEQIADISLSVKKSGSSVYETFEIKYIKAFETPISKAIFLNRVSDKNINLELGNGYHGEWIPNSSIDILVKITKGSIGNSLKRTEGSYKGSLTLNQYDSSNNLISNSLISFIGNSSKAFIIDFFNSQDGTDVLTGSELRSDIIKWIESRDNLINENDFKNTFQKDVSVFFKKSQVIDNNFYIQKVIRDRYQNIIQTDNCTYKCLRYQDPLIFQNISKDFQYNISSTLTVGVYQYKIISVGIFFQSVPSDTISVELSSQERSIVLSWDKVDGASYYLVYGRDGLFNQYWTIPSTQVDLNGKIYFEDTGLPGTTGKINNTYLVHHQVNFPVFEKSVTKSVINNFLLANYSDKIYFISDIDFFIPPDQIKYDSAILLKKDSLSDLTNNSWTVVNKRIYLMFDGFFSLSNNIELIWNNTYQLVSPFIYKYNDFFDWFEGYYLKDNMIVYPLLSNVVDQYSSQIFYYNLVYDYSNNITNIYLKSYQDINLFDFRVLVENYDVSYVKLTYNQEDKSFKHSVPGFISTPTKIKCDCFVNDSKIFESETSSFQQVYPLTDQITLLNYYDENDDRYICNIPVAKINDLNAFEKEYFNSQVFDFIVGADLNKNRIQSDSIQTRFLNTIYCPASISNKILVQNYDFDVIFPLNISITIKYNNNEEDFNQQKEDLELIIAKYLQDNSTGMNIKYYNSKIIDIIHDFNSNIVSVNVCVYDQNNSYLNDGIEVVKRSDLFLNINDKLEIVKYSDIFWWWNLNNININFTTC